MMAPAGCGWRVRARSGSSSDALGVMPHAVAVDQARSGGGADVEHPAVDVRGNAGDHAGGGCAQTGGPVSAHDVVVGADAAAGDDNGLSGQVELADYVTVGRYAAGRVVGGQHRAAHAGDRAAGQRELVDPVAVMEGDQARLRGPQGGADERFDDAGAGAPRDVESGDGVAVPVGPPVTALGPADGGQERDAVAGQPGSFLPGGELDIGACPSDGPGVLVVEPVELGAAPPVVPGQVEGVLDAQAPLFRGVDHEQAAERPPGLPTEVGGVLLVDERDLLAGAGQFVGRDQTGQAGADNDDVSIHESADTRRSLLVGRR